jgi:hypothetical protein
MIEASPTLPGRILYIHAPVNSAAGIVARIVNMPQELSLSAFTTTIATLASTATTINSVVSAVVAPPTGPMNVRASFGSVSPLCRTEATRTTKSCTPPAMHAPRMIQMKPGK